MYPLYILLFLVAMSNKVADATITSTQKQYEEGKYLITKISIHDIKTRGVDDTVVKLYIPFNYHVLQIKDDRCQKIYRDIFDFEIYSLTCSHHKSSSFEILLNGTTSFYPVRIPVQICTKSDGICWDNEKSWKEPSAYEQFISCQYVAISVLCLWMIFAILICACVCYHNQKRLPLQKRKRLKKRRFAIETENDDLLNSEPSEDEINDMKKTYVDKVGTSNI